MNTKNYLSPTKRYKALISSIHSVYRLINSTYELNDLIAKLARLICQVFNADNCTILLLDPAKDHSTLKCHVTEKKRTINDKRTKITNRLELRIIKTLTSIRNEKILATVS